MEVEEKQESYFARDYMGRISGKFKLVGGPDLVATVEYAMNCYGFLIERNEQISPKTFIERIRAAYDCDESPQNAAVVRALAQLL